MAHYTRWKNHGDPLTVLNPRSETGVCSVDECGQPHIARGLCAKHYTRLQAHGDVDTVKKGGKRRREGHRAVMKSGYITIYDPTHELAPKTGNMLEHRIVLFDKIGFGPHLCHHCGAPIGWRQPIPYRLETDHLDWDVANNHPANLVQSCIACNSHRHRQKPFPKDCALVPPNTK